MLYWRNPMKKIDNFLSKFTLYRLTLYCLIILILEALIFSIFHLVPFNFWDMILNALFVLIVGIIANYFFAKIFGAKTSTESVLITLLVLILIIPLKFSADLILILAITILAVASKYLLTIEKHHIFNPVAISAVAAAFLFPEKSAIWWIGVPIMLPLVIMGGFLVVRKIKAEKFVATFLTFYLIGVAALRFLGGGSWLQVIVAWRLTLSHTALIFFALIMLTEPMTAPFIKKKRHFFAILVAILYSNLQRKIFGIDLTPEMSLCIGNIYAFAVNSKFFSRPKN